jgi:dihydropteroate synthase
LSIDTYYSEVAAEAVAAGADMVNDISAGQFDPNMLSTVAALQTPYIAMHIQGTPQTMQQAPHYTDVVTEVLDYCIAKQEACRQAGIKDLVLDPGFGFGKTITHNYTLLRRLSALQITGLPILVGLSRKSMIWKKLSTSAAEALNGTSVLHTVALLQGAHILRVHDVKEAVETIRLVAAVKADA